VGREGGGIDGITWRRETNVLRNRAHELIWNLDDIPLQDYGFVPDLQTYWDPCGIPRAIALLEVGRGDVFSAPSRSCGNAGRGLFIPRISHEMRCLRDLSGAECFLLAYDQLTADQRFVEDFCWRVMDEGLNDTPWYRISRLDSMDVALLRLMRMKPDGLL